MSPTETAALSVLAIVAGIPMLVALVLAASWWLNRDAPTVTPPEGWEWDETRPLHRHPDGSWEAVLVRHHPLCRAYGVGHDRDAAIERALMAAEQTETWTGARGGAL